MQQGCRFSFAFKPSFKRRKDLGWDDSFLLFFFFSSFLCLKPALQKQHLQRGCRLWVPEELGMSCWAQRSPGTSHGVCFMPRRHPEPGSVPESSSTAQTLCAALVGAWCCHCWKDCPDTCGFSKLNFSPTLRKLGWEGRIIA